MRKQPFAAFAVTLVLAAPAAAREPKPEDTWPGFRGHAMSGVAPAAKLPETWSKTQHVTWSVPIDGHGWSSPIVWGDRVFVTSAISSRPFKKPTPGLYGNEYIAEMSAQGLSDEEMTKRSAARDGESTSEADEIRYMVYALDATTGNVVWSREAIRTKPFGGRHRKNTYASETPFTDGQRLYVSFGQNVGLFVYSLDGTLLWKKQWTPHAIYLDFGTASSPVVSDGRVYLLQDNEEQPSLVALDGKTGAELWRTARSGSGFPVKSSWMTPFVWKNGRRTEIVTTGLGAVVSYDLEGRELWRVNRMSMPTASPFAADGLLYVGTGSQGDANRPFLAVRPGAAGDITLKPGETSNAFVVWLQPRVAGYTPSAIVHDGRAFVVHDTGVLTVLDAKTGKQIYRVRVGGGGQTFSASPIAAGDRVFLLTEEGVTFVLDSGPEYKEIARNDLEEMSLASPAAAGGAIYIRTESKLYKIAN
jgi:outer membrane protein assembly factor BamB